jgi:molecular chaperone DnaK
LKIKAEEAKIRVSENESTEIDIKYLCDSDDRSPVHFHCTIKRSAVESIAEPFIRRSVTMCRRVLAAKRLGDDEVEKLILVGEPTTMPYLRERLSDRQDGLGIPLDFRVDPSIVVVRGAAVFAGTQRVKVRTPQPVSEVFTSTSQTLDALSRGVKGLYGGKKTRTETPATR